MLTFLRFLCGLALRLCGESVKVKAALTSDSILMKGGAHDGKN